jgi:DNA-binding MarR family transcriptional regulator
MNQNRDALWAGMVGLQRRITSEMQEGLAAIADLNLPMPQSLTLYAVDEHGPLTISALQRVLRRSQSATSHLVNQLEARGLAVRKADAADGRRTTVELTRRGKTVVGKVQALRRHGFERVMGRLPPKVADRLAAALSAALKSLEEDSK